MTDSGGTHAGFWDVFLIFECHSTIFRSLPRSSLKNLRLTCKAINDLVASPASHLFSQAYISTFRADLDVLDKVANQPQIARCVRNLICDVSEVSDRKIVARDVEGHVISNDSPQYGVALSAYKRQNKEAGEIRRRAMDFKALLTALSHFPRLEKVVITRLMEPWRYNQPDNDSAGMCAYLSPAMREWTKLRICELSFPLIDPTNSHDGHVDRDDDASAILFHLSQVSTALADGTETAQHKETEKSDPALANSLKQLQLMYHRPLNMLVFALQHLNIKLKELCVAHGLQDGFCATRSFNIHRAVTYPSECNGQKVIRTDYNEPAVPLFFFDKWNPILDAFTDTLLYSLRRLCLTINFGSSNGRLQKEDAAHNLQASRNLLRTLESATSLEVLELRSATTAYADFPAFMLRNSENLFRTKRLEKMVLDNFFVGSREFEQEVLPWCFANKLPTLHLRACTILGAANAMSDKDFLRSLVEKDIRFDPNNDNLKTGAENQSPDTTTDSDDRTSFYSDDPDYDDWEYEYEYKDAPRTTFLDLDFGSEASGSEHEEYREYDDELFGFGDDEAYFPCTRELWSLHLDAPIPDLFDVYWEHHHPEITAAYDEQFIADTAGIEMMDEFPVPPLTPNLAWRLFGIDGATVDEVDVDLMLCGKDWCTETGCEPHEHILRLNLEGFKYISA